MLHKVYEELYVQLAHTLSGLSPQRLYPAQLLTESLKVIRGTFNALKENMVMFPFLTKADEIYFYKHLKPKFYAEKIWCFEMYNLEMNRPIGRFKKIKGFVEDELWHIEHFFRQNAFLYQYYRSGAVELDNLYFAKEAEVSSVLMPVIPELESEISSGMDFLFAKFIAFEKLQEYLLYLVRKEEGIPSSLTKTQDPETDPFCTWTDSKVSLIELAYAVHARGSVDNGKADVKEIIKGLEHGFRVNLGNFYGVFTQNIRLRKKNRTVYLDQLKEHLERRMDDLDE